METSFEAFLRNNFPKAMKKSLLLMDSFKSCVILHVGIFTASKPGLGQGNVFTPVCQSFCSQGVVYTPLRQTLPQGRHPSRQTAPGQTHPPPRQTPAPEGN